LVTTLALATAALAATGWVVVRSPGTSTNAVIYAASARTNTDVWAVGTAFGTAGSTPPPSIAYHWAGTSWALVPTPNVGGRGGGLLGVSASSASDAWAVGFVLGNGGYRNNSSLFEHWNGTAWSVVAGTNVGRLAAVADLSAANAWAVSTNGTIVHWDGTAWTAANTPQPNPSNTFGNRVSAMSAAGPSDVWVVGSYTTPSYTDAVYSLHYDGATWTLVPMAQPANGTPTIGAVTVLSPTQAWAVGEAGNTAMAEHWDGKAWSFMPAPTGVQYPMLTAVAARAANDLWAFGSGVESDGTRITVLVQWGGTRWTAASSPTAADLYAAATTPAGSRTWAFGVGPNAQPLILSHS
jgi:hypothetical protein